MRMLKLPNIYYIFFNVPPSFATFMYLLLFKICYLSGVQISHKVVTVLRIQGQLKQHGTTSSCGKVELDMVLRIESFLRSRAFMGIYPNQRKPMSWNDNFSFIPFVKELTIVIYV